MDDGSIAVPLWIMTWVQPAVFSLGLFCLDRWIWWRRRAVVANGLIRSVQAMLRDGHVEVARSVLDTWIEMEDQTNNRWTWKGWSWRRKEKKGDEPHQK